MNKEIREYKTILKNNGKNNLFENKLLRKIIKLSEQLLAEQAKNKKLVEALEKITETLSCCYDHCDTKHKECANCEYTDVCNYYFTQQALNEVNK